MTSLALLGELERTLSYPKLARVFPDPFLIVELVAESFEFVVPDARLAVLDDEPDNRLLEAAIGHADYVLSGDTALLGLGSYENVRLVTPQQFLTIL